MIVTVFYRDSKTHPKKILKFASMLTDLAILVAGLALVILGAGWLTDGSSCFAKRLGVTEFMIGMTIIAVGTSLPEFVVSVASALSGKPDLSMGNIIGSNTFNIFAIIGLTAVISPIGFTVENIRKDIPVALAVSVLFALMARDTLLGFSTDTLSRLDGAILLGLYICFIIYVAKSSKDKDNAAKSAPSETTGGWKIFIMIAVGLVSLIVGARLFINGATGVSKALGISDAVIGITVVAVGTSLPELAASVAAALKGRTSMAVGNILGSNIANILLIMGTSSLITPLYITDIRIMDLGFMVLAPVMLLIFALFFGIRKITRIEGVILLLIYISYTISLLNP